MAVSTIDSSGLTSPLSATNLGTPSAINLSNATALAKAALPTGCILQVASAYKTDTQSIAGNSTATGFVDITGLSVTLTPTSSSSKFLAIWSVAMGNGADASHGYVRLNRNGTAIALADTAGSRTSASSAVINTAIGGQQITSSNTYLDSPATASAVTYKLTAASGASTTYINRSSRDSDGNQYDGRSTSSLTVVEIAG